MNPARIAKSLIFVALAAVVLVVLFEHRSMPFGALRNSVGVHPHAAAPAALVQQRSTLVNGAEARHAPPAPQENTHDTSSSTHSSHLALPATHKPPQHQPQESTVARLPVVAVDASTNASANLLSAHPRKKLASGKTPADMVVVTGASENHFHALVHFVERLRRIEPSVPLVVYDLGLTACQHDAIRTLPGVDELRTFPFEKYPSHFRLNSKDPEMAVRSGQYAWKPVIVREVVDEYGVALWLDSGDQLSRPLQGARKRLYDERIGFLSTRTQDVIERYVHPGTRRYFNVTHTRFNQLGNCNGAVVGFNRASSAYHDILLPWEQCALHLECIAPEGSSRLNHRQDQAALSLLAHMADRFANCNDYKARDAGIALWRNDWSSKLPCPLPSPNDHPNEAPKL